MKVLHIIPESVVHPKFYYSGSTKDIFGRTEYFTTRSIEVERLIVKRDDDLLFEELQRLPLEDFSVILVELLIYPRSMRYMRQRNPFVRMFCRSINAELYHKAHLYISNIKDQCRYGKPLVAALFANWHVIIKGFNNFRKEIKCGKLSDMTFSITEWELKHYWRLFLGNKAVTLPYFLPEVYVQEIRAVSDKKENICIAFMGVDVKEGSFLSDSFYNFTKLVDQLGDDLGEWSFQITGKLHEKYVYDNARVDILGFAETPYPVLARSKAVAIMSPLGMGFKTKILEAILSGCYVLVPVQLKKRLPEEVKPFCFGVDLNSVESFKLALRRCDEPFPSQDPNLILKKNAFLKLDDFFIKRFSCK